MNFHFDSEDAQKYGVEEAVMLYNFKFWISYNAARGVHIKDGHAWTYNSIRHLAKIFPFWKKTKIDRLVQSLVKQGAIIKKVAPVNPDEPMSRINWYCLNNVKNNSIETGTEDVPECPGSGTTCPESETGVVPDPVHNNIINTTDRNTDNNKKLKQKDFDPRVQELFDHWKLVMNHPRSMLDKKREEHIKSALKLGYSKEDLRQAIDGCASTPHNMGKNDRNEVYDGLHIIFKSADQIDRFIRNASNPPTKQNKMRHDIQQLQNEMFGGGYEAR